MARPPALIRQTKVFDLVVAGHSYEQICKRLKISEDTVARDMEAIADQVHALVRERHGEILAVALAHYTEVVNTAWAEYKLDQKREADWLVGKLDYTTFERTEKTLAVKNGPSPSPNIEDDGDDDADLGAMGDYLAGLDGDILGPRPDKQSHGSSEESLPLEVRTKVTKVRPTWRSDRAKWLKLVIDATREVTELTGLKVLSIPTGPSLHVHMTLDEWKAQKASRLTQAEQTLALLDESDDA